MGRNYRVQHFGQECENCRHFDWIKEQIDPADKSKIRIYICQIGHREVEKRGVCDLWIRKEKK